MMGWYGSGMGGGAWLLMGLFWFALVALIIFLVIRLLPDTSGAERPPSQHLPASETPLEILDKRLARGELDLETYKAQRAALIESSGERR